MTRGPRPWTLPAPWTAKNAAHRALENADGVFHKRPPAIMSGDHQNAWTGRGRLRAAAGVR